MKAIHMVTSTGLVMATALIAALSAGCGQNEQRPAQQNATTPKTAVKSGRVELTDTDKYSLLSAESKYAMLTEYFNLKGDLAQQLRGSGVDNFVLVFAGNDYTVEVMPGSPQNRGRLSIVDHLNKVVSVSDPAGQKVDLVAYVDNESKLEIRKTADGHRALILRAKGASAFINQNIPWVQTLAKTTSAEIWKAGAYEVIRSKDDGVIEFAIPEEQSSFLTIPLRPK